MIFVVNALREGDHVFDAVDSGELAASRYASYVELLDEIDPENAYDPNAEIEDDPED